MIMAMIMGDDDISFREYMAGTKEIFSDKIAPEKPAARPPTPLKHGQSQDHSVDRSLYTRTSLPGAATFASLGVQKTLMRKLQQGKIMRQQDIDLHGLNVYDALEEVNCLLDHCQDMFYKCALIIHGQGFHSKNGYAEIRENIRHYLAQDGRVLAYSRALQRDGGDGAMYVLIRTKR